MLSLLTGHNILFALTSGTLRPSMGARQIGVASGPHVGPVRSRPVVLLIAVIPLRVDLVAGGTPDRHGCNQRSTRGAFPRAAPRAGSRRRHAADPRRQRRQARCTPPSRHGRRPRPRSSSVARTSPLSLPVPSSSCAPHFLTSPRPASILVALVLSLTLRPVVLPPAAQRARVLLP